MNAIKQYFPVVFFVMLLKEVLTYAFVVEITMFYHSYQVSEHYFSFGTLCLKVYHRCKFSRNAANLRIVIRNDLFCS